MVIRVNWSNVYKAFKTLPVTYKSSWYIWWLFKQLTFSEKVYACPGKKKKAIGKKLIKIENKNFSFRWSLKGEQKAMYS